MGGWQGLSNRESLASMGTEGLKGRKWENSQTQSSAGELVPPDNRVPKRVSTRQPCPQEGFLDCVNAWREASDSTEKNAESQGHSCALMDTSCCARGQNQQTWGWPGIMPHRGLRLLTRTRDN